MELHQLRYFVQVAKLESVSQAAETLHVSQPALSRSITKLEEELGATLFDRVGRRVLLNDRGRMYLRSVEGILRGLSEANAAIGGVQTDVEGSVNVGVFGSQSQAIECISGFMTAHPRIFVSFAGADNANPTGMVDSEGYVLDMNGDQAVKAGTVKTVLTVNSVATEMVLILGGQDAAATLGQGFQYGEGSLNAKMYPGLADKKTFTRDDCTVENVAAIAPDLVLIDVPETVQALRAAGINAAAGSVTSPATIMSMLDLIAQAMGGDALQKAESYRQEYEGVIDELTQAVEKAGLTEQDKPGVLYLRGIDSCCGAGSMPDNWITTVGGRDVAAELGLNGSRAEIGLEAIMSADPDIIVCESPATYADLIGTESLSELSALKNGTVYTAPLGPVVWSMGSTEALLMLYWAANTINPDLFSYDVQAITREYFTTFYGYELSDEELDGILNQQ